MSQMPPDAFNCPHCGVYAQEHPFPPRVDYVERTSLDYGTSCRTVPGWRFVFCDHCRQESVWFHDRMVYPDVEGGPPPNPDLPAESRGDYLEARAIVGRSPRGAAALLRLCIQKICKHLGAEGEHLSTDIGNLVSKGLPPPVQQALDAVRVIGNEAVHPGQMDLRDDRRTAETLFKLVNLVTQRMITDPKEVQEVYDGLPQAKRDQIARRDQDGSKGGLGHDL